MPYAPGYTLQSEGEASALRQTKLENIGNNFRKKVADKLNGSDSLTDEQHAELQAAIDEYASKYEFGVRQAGTGAKRIVDPVEREMNRLAREDITAALKAHDKPRPEKEELASAVEKLIEKRNDDYRRRAQRNLRDREKAGTEMLEAAGIA